MYWLKQNHCGGCHVFFTCFWWFESIGFTYADTGKVAVSRDCAVRVRKSQDKKTPQVNLIQWTLCEYLKWIAIRKIRYIQVCLTSPMIFCQPRYRLGHPFIYFFILKEMFTGSNYPNNILLYFENRNTELDPIVQGVQKQFVMQKVSLYINIWRLVVSKLTYPSIDKR